jgi:hypothetical protein
VAGNHFVGFVEFEVGAIFATLAGRLGGFVLVADEVAARGGDFIEGNSEGKGGGAGDEHFAPGVGVARHFEEFASDAAFPFDGVEEVVGLGKVEDGRGLVGFEGGSGSGQVDGLDGFGFEAGDGFDLDVDFGFGTLAGAVNKGDSEGKEDEDKGKDDLFVMVAKDVGEVAEAVHGISGLRVIHHRGTEAQRGSGECIFLSLCLCVSVVIHKAAGRGAALVAAAGHLMISMSMMTLSCFSSRTVLPKGSTGTGLAGTPLAGGATGGGGAAPGSATTEAAGSTRTDLRRKPLVDFWMSWTMVASSGLKHWNSKM